MTLNYSHWSFFPVNPCEGNTSSFRDRYVFEGMSEKNGGAYGNPSCFDFEFGNAFDCGKDGVDKGASFESVTNDIIDLLPSDPFGMGISATLTAFTGWVEDFESDRFNIMWNRNLMFPKEPGKNEVYERVNQSGGFDGNMGELRSVSRQDECALLCNAEKYLSFNNEDAHVSSQQFTESEKGTGIFHGVDGGPPHEALMFALGNLDLVHLLLAESVCRSFHSAIQSDVLLWKDIHIDKALCKKITDDALLSLTNRAQGNLQCLSLVDCLKITDNGLKRVLESNPRLTKLNVAGCLGLSVDGLVNNLKAFKSSGASGVNHLRIRDLYGVTREHFEELKSLVDTDKCMQPKDIKPHYYSYGDACDDDRAIDIEVCPKCDKSKLVYDCSAKSCQAKQSGTHICRACILCIPRCIMCGRCVNDSEYVETFSLDKVCSDCWKQLLSCEERQKQMGEHAIFHHETGHRIQFWG